MDKQLGFQRGYIFETHGAFHVRYYTVVDGVRKQVSQKLCDKDRNKGYGSTSAQAVVELCEDFMRAINKGLDAQECCPLCKQELPNPSRLTINTFWDSIYLPFITTTKKHSTVFGYKQMWKRYLQPHLGKILFHKYTTPEASKFLTELSKTLKPRTVTHIRWLASGVFMHAINTGHAKHNPWQEAKILGAKLEHGVTESYSLVEAEQVINALIDRVDCQLMVALAFFAGLRKGEIQGLQWGDYDGEQLHIRRAFGRGQLGTPKTRKSVRTVPVIAPLKLLLGAWQQRCLGQFGSKPGCYQWVFPSERGTAVSLDGVAGRIIRPALERAGVPWKGYHACRRGLGTTLRGLTGNSNAGRDMLGHSDERVTQDHYEDRMPEELLKGMKMLETKVLSTKP